MPIIDIRDLTYTYPSAGRQKEPRVALRNITLGVGEGTIFSLLGPNGSGKSTLFKLLSTLTPLQEGSVQVRGYDLSTQSQQIRSSIGVVFQHPSLDIKLTARENLMHQGHLYGLRGVALRKRIEEGLEIVGIRDRASELVESFSGGMQRKVELAKSLLHRPAVLLLDEPSTGLDPGSRIDFGRYLKNLRDNFGTTILLTTHILDEAEICDTIAIFNHGSLVACNTPARLKAEIGGDIISLRANDPVQLAGKIRDCFSTVQPQVMGNMVHIEWAKGAEFIPTLVQRFPGEIETVTLSKPTLDDVFIRKTGRSLWDERIESEGKAA